jgi:hypothetical protein
MTDSKIRIAIYGSKEVVESVADFFRRYDILQALINNEAGRIIA